MNQRIIKFRAQKSDTKEWIYFTLGDLVCCEATTKGKGFDWENWCEFTGLTDKNGKEIYEGDIITFDYPMEVIWDMGSWAVKTKRGSSLLYGYLNECEVIGNIYETPELLK